MGSAEFTFCTRFYEYNYFHDNCILMSGLPYVRLYIYKAQPQQSGTSGLSQGILLSFFAPPMLQ